MPIKKDFETTPSQELRAVGNDEGRGKEYLKEAEELQIDLSAILADVLQRRQAIKKCFGATDDEADKEIEHICKLFNSSNRRSITGRFLNVYNVDRYPERSSFRITNSIPEKNIEIAKQEGK